MFAYDFNRADANCGKGSDCAALTADTYNKIRLITTTTSLWYWLHPALKVGAQWVWQDASNTPSDVQVAVGCSGRNGIVSANAAGTGGKDCGWSTVRMVLWGQF